MAKPIGDTQQTAESWETGAGLINASQLRVVYRDENGILHTVATTISQEIFGGTDELIILSGEIIEPQPVV